MSWIKSTLIFFLISLITIKAIDITFGYFNNKGSERLFAGERVIHLREYYPEQRAAITPTDIYMLGTDSLEQKEYSVAIDSDGFIANGNESISQGLNEIKIVFLGGSTTEAIYVSEQNRFSSVVERKLRNLHSSQIVTLNGGMSGINSFHSLLNFQAKVIPKDVQIAVLMNNINDLSLLVKTGSYWNAPVSKAIVLSNSEELSAYSIAYSILKYIKNLIFPNLYLNLKPRLFPNMNTDEFKEYRNTNTAFEEHVVISQFERSLRSFVELCNIWGVKPVLMTQFNRVNPDDVMFKGWVSSSLLGFDERTFVNLYQEFNQTIRKVALQTDTHLIDLDKEVPKSSKYIYDIFHLNDKGSLLVGDIVSRELLNVLQVDPMSR